MRRTCWCALLLLSGAVAAACGGSGGGGGGSSAGPAPASGAPTGGSTQPSTFLFGTSPMALDDIGLIEPMGVLVGGHVTPVDHQYYQPTVFQSAPDRYEVRAPANATIVLLQRRPRPNSGAITEEFRMFFQITPTFSCYYDLVTILAPKLRAAFDALPSGSQAVSLPVTEGEVIGKIGGQTLDFGVVDDNVTLTGFVVPSHYDRETWKIHTVDPFDHFREPLRSSLLAKNPRRVAPLGGKIDFDVDGKLIGNWFRVGTNGYAGVNPSAYWEGHLSIVPDHLDPSQIRVSLGDFGGQPLQFGVHGNAPDPAPVEVATGLVKYELVGFRYFLGNTMNVWDNMSFASDVRGGNLDTQVGGVVLLQLLATRSLKVETFAGKTASQVTGFTSAALLYER